MHGSAKFTTCVDKHLSGNKGETKWKRAGPVSFVPAKTLVLACPAGPRGARPGPKPTGLTGPWAKTKKNKDERGKGGVRGRRKEQRGCAVSFCLAGGGQELVLGAVVH